jgi:hypothetical protein
MEFLIVDCKNEIIPGARAGMPNSRTIGEIRITANNSAEIYRLIAEMEKWASGTFVEPVPPPEPEPEPEPYVDVDPITGMPIS